MPRAQANSRALILVGLSTLILFVLGALIEWWRWHGAQPRMAEAPILSQSERSHLKTEAQPCKGASDCEPPLACAFDFWSKTYKCLASECITDLHCPSGLVCHGFPSKSGSVVRRCGLAGDRKEGEYCNVFARYRELACG
jgi:hypothetical protein